MYSEALGRIPDAAGWVAAVGAFREQGCTKATVGQVLRSFYTSPEFMALPYEPANRILAIYRGALNREPDQGGLDYFSEQLRQGRATWAQVVDQFVASGEFSHLVPLICGSRPSYYFGAHSAPFLPPSGEGFTGGTGKQSQMLLDQAPAGATVYLAKSAVVRLTETLTIPEGRTLATAGLPEPRAYAAQGRLVRDGAFAAPMIRLLPGAKLRNAWVDGQRGDFREFAAGAINIQTMGGSGTEVSSSKISNSRGWTNVQVFGSYEGYPCLSTVIVKNLITAYSSDNVKAADGSGRWTDGISTACENSKIEGNSVIDATDVGIVLFRSSPAKQQSLVRGNQLLNAGNSAWGSIGVDSGWGRGTVHDLSGALVTGNSFWTGPYSHVAIGLVVGTRPWFGRQNDAATGVKVTDNTTNGLTAVVGTGIAVSDMDNAILQRNDLILEIRSVTNCPSVALGIDRGGHPTGGDLQVGFEAVSFTSASGDGCIG
ncbi:DUF4214 domain-containing protein [Micromonospora sp. NPDC005324]|uniref:DUF4214 domain-containing protein n=1 Tax=Micromonospora sp. NPDC005324 TaxID=3157033 RepID=UPI0033AE5310